jgi:hypothetical protein
MTFVLIAIYVIGLLITTYFVLQRNILGAYDWIVVTCWPLFWLIVGIEEFSIWRKRPKKSPHTL